MFLLSPLLLLDWFEELSYFMFSEIIFTLKKIIFSFFRGRVGGLLSYHFCVSNAMIYLTLSYQFGFQIFLKENFFNLALFSMRL